MLKIVRRGKEGIFQIIGTVAGTRVRESTGVASERHAEAKRAKREAELLDGATWGRRRTATFAEAVILYRQKGHSGRFLAPLNEHFGLTRMADITDLDIANFASLVYPNARPQTINRQVYSPMVAVWRVAHAAGMCAPHEFRRPKQPERDAVEYIRDDALAVLLPCCGERLKAALMFLSFTAARASEVCRVVSPDVDWEARTVLLRKTKGGKPRTVVLAPLLYEALLPLKGREGALFGFGQRFSLNQALARACRRAGLPRMTSHAVGRHAFAARLLRQGRSLKEVQEAGGWSAKSMPMVAEIYAHLERGAADRAVREADTDLAQILDRAENIKRFQGVRRA